MAQGDAQTNRRLGEASIALFLGRDPEWLPPCPCDIHPITPNQFDEACAVALAAGLAGAEEQATRRLKQQRDKGHCQKAKKSEFLSDSHAPIQYRAMALGLWAARRSSPSVAALYLQWWGRECFACDLLLVPSGPRANSVVGLNGRYQDGWDDTRDVCQALINGRPHGKSAAYFRRAEERQDTLPSLIVRELVKDGAFDEMRREPPMLPFPYVVEKYEDGHLTRTPEGGLQPGDPELCWVRYSDGVVGTKPIAEDDLGASLGTLASSRTLGREVV